MSYRAGEITLPATGTLAADSGKSIFLEESYHQLGQVKTFRWEIPYPSILELGEVSVGPKPSSSLSTPREEETESALEPGLQLKNRPA